MAWDDLSKNHKAWPSVTEVRDYRQQVCSQSWQSCLVLSCVGRLVKRTRRLETCVYLCGCIWHAK